MEFDLGLDLHNMIMKAKEKNISLMNQIFFLYIHHKNIFWLHITVDMCISETLRLSQKICLYADCKRINQCGSNFAANHVKYFAVYYSILKRNDTESAALLMKFECDFFPFWSIACCPTQTQQCMITRILRETKRNERRSMTSKQQDIV